MTTLTRHVKQRYCERILRVPETEIKAYMVEHDDRISSDLLKMLEHSTYLWRGQLFDNVTKDYHLADDIVLCVASESGTLVTLFRVDFGFPPDVNKSTLKSLVAEKNKVDKKRIKAEQTVEQRTLPIRNELMDVEEQLGHLKAQVETLEARKDALERELSTAGYEVQMHAHEAERIAKMICNSVELKEDILSWKNGRVS